MQYLCSVCGEAVSNELPESVLETGTIVKCFNCVITGNWISLATEEDHKLYDAMMANELEACIKHYQEKE